MTIETGCGSVHHPWVIRASPGQQINLTLYDFWQEQSYTSNEVLGEMIETHICKEYAHVREINTDWNSVVCGGGRRIHHVYLSKTHALEVQITNKDTKYFLLRYEGKFCILQTSCFITVQKYAWNVKDTCRFMQNKFAEWTGNVALFNIHMAILLWIDGSSYILDIR